MKRTTHFNKVEANDFSVNGNTIVTITEDTTKTVGAGKDFGTLVEAMAWVNTQTTKYPAKITLTLDDGTHEAADGVTLYITGVNLVITSAGGVAANCTINAFAAITGTRMFTQNDGICEFLNITIDGATGGASNTGLYCKGGTMNVNSSTITNFMNGIDMAGRTAVVNLGQSILIDNGTGISVASGAYSEAFFQTFESNTTGIVVSGGGIVSYQISTFTTNTADVSIPINEIQYSGSYVTDNAAALAFKA